jgi:hypothetical protein
MDDHRGMTALDDRFQANEPGVVADVINDETLIMNLDSGDYYSLNPPAGVLWSLLSPEYVAAISDRPSPGGTGCSRLRRRSTLSSPDCSNTG